MTSFLVFHVGRSGLALCFVGFVLGIELFEHGGDLLIAVVLLHNEVLEPSVFRLEERNATFELGNLIRHFLGGFLQSLLALLLLDAESGTRGGVPSPLILLRSQARLLFEAHRPVGGFAGACHRLDVWGLLRVRRRRHWGRVMRLRIGLQRLNVAQVFMEGRHARVGEGIEVGKVEIACHR